jgi:exonuclease VII small subunit
MSKFLHTIVIALSLAVGVVQAEETQLALVQRTFDALRQSTTALEGGDAGKAKSLLADIKSSAEMLRGSAERFSKQAASAADKREIEARNITDRITETFQAEQAANERKRNYEAEIAGLTTQLEKANATRDALEAQAAVYRGEVDMRNRCNAHFLQGMFWNGACWRLSFQDVFAHRWIDLNNNIDVNNKQRSDIEIQRSKLNSMLDAQNSSLSATIAQKKLLEARRKELEEQAGTLRAAVVSLSDASHFWTDTVTLINSGITSIETLQQNLQLLVGRAGRTSKAPVFDSYEKEIVRSLEATLIDFARTLDNRTNILLQQ